MEGTVEGGGRKDVLVEVRGGEVVGRGGVVEEGIKGGKDRYIHPTAGGTERRGFQEPAKEGGEKYLGVT